MDPGIEIRCLFQCDLALPQGLFYFAGKPNRNFIGETTFLLRFEFSDKSPESEGQSQTPEVSI